jgi:serine/threonine-protein kinase
VDSRYELGEQIASGGMADVFAARDRTLDRRVAIKRLRTDLSDEGARDRFTREAHALAGFSHENAVAVFDAGDDADGPYIVMELVEGPTLAAYLRERGRLSFEEATSIVEQMLAVLGAAHAQGIVHRDVKPANVLLADDGRVKLADFGIAKVVSDAEGDLTLDGHVLGTPTYLAPERAAGHEATPQSDIYSVAVIGYEMVAGKPPFKGEHMAATLAAHQRAPIPSLLDVRPDAPDEYVATIERGLAKDAAERFGSAEEMRDALTQRAYDETMAIRTMAMPLAPTPLRDPEPTPMPTPPPRRSKPAAPQTKAKTKPKPKPKTEAQSPTPVWPWVLVGALVLALVAGAFVALTGNDEPLLDTAAQEPIVTTTPPTLPATLVPQVPQTLAQAIALLTVDPKKYGSAGDDLLERLEGYQAKPHALRAEDIVNRVNEWVAKGELDARFGAAVIGFVSGSIAAPPIVSPVPAAPAAQPGQAPKGKGPKGKR